MIDSCKMSEENENLFLPKFIVTFATGLCVVGLQRFIQS